MYGLQAELPSKWHEKRCPTHRRVSVQLLHVDDVVGHRGSRGPSTAGTRRSITPRDGAARAAHARGAPSHAELPADRHLGLGARVDALVARAARRGQPRTEALVRKLGPLAPRRSALRGGTLRRDRLDVSV